LISYEEKGFKFYRSPDQFYFPTAAITKRLLVVVVERVLERILVLKDLALMTESVLWSKEGLVLG